ncbi:plasmid pRiA4b ORF-3 family protein, partial [Escherichia coli]|uniref:plasmid pRiA4b ORF-3 family protein n=3 Tax=Enterobacterales TaxID=91347 RepID=UPI001F135EBF
PQNDVTLKMPAFEWVHVQLHQQKGMISLSPPTICNSADDFAFDAGDRFTYEYNFFEHWLHDIRVEAIYENSTLKAPFCISGHGMPGATAADEFDKTLAFLEAIVNADDETTVGEIRPFADDLDAVRFNRHKINRQLSRLDLASPVLEPEVIWLGRRR